MYKSNVLRVFPLCSKQCLLYGVVRCTGRVSRMPSQPCNDASSTSRVERGNLYPRVYITKGCKIHSKGVYAVPSSRHRVHTLGSYTSQPRLYAELSERNRRPREEGLFRPPSPDCGGGMRSQYDRWPRPRRAVPCPCTHACGRHFHGKRKGSWISREAPRGISQRKSEPRTTRRPRAHGA